MGEHMQRLHYVAEPVTDMQTAELSTWRVVI